MVAAWLSEVHTAPPLSIGCGSLMISVCGVSCLVGNIVHKNVLSRLKG